MLENGTSTWGVWGPHTIYRIRHGLCTLWGRLAHTPGWRNTTSSDGVRMRKRGIRRKLHDGRASSSRAWVSGCRRKAVSLSEGEIASSRETWRPHQSPRSFESKRRGHFLGPGRPSSGRTDCDGHCTGVVPTSCTDSSARLSSWVSSKFGSRGLRTRNSVSIPPRMAWAG